MNLQLRSAMFLDSKLQDTLGAGLILRPEIGLLMVSPVQNQEVYRKWSALRKPALFLLSRKVLCHNPF